MRVDGLRKVRERLLVTQAELSQRSGVTESTISRLEAGKQAARISTVRKLAESLGVPPAEILETTDDTPA